MRRLTSAVAISVVTIMTLGAQAGAQDVIGEIIADPPSVPEAGDYEITANGSGMIPDTGIIMTVCVSPADELVPGVSTEEEIIEAATMIGLENCDLAGALSVSVDSAGDFTATMTVTVGPNTFLSAGDVALTQAAVTWIPIVSAAPTELAETGAESLPFVLVGFALIGLGAIAILGSRRFRAV